MISDVMENKEFISIEFQLQDKQLLKCYVIQQRIWTTKTCEKWHQKTHFMQILIKWHISKTRTLT